MKTETPIYAALLAEAKRRTRKGSPERVAINEMDIVTTPKENPAS